MRRATNLKRVLEAVSTVVFALACGSAAGQGVMKTAPTPNRNITLAGPQGPHAPSGPALPGTIEGFVYWDTSTVTHNPAGACDGFSVSVIAGGHVLQAASGQFGARYIGQVKSYLVGGKIIAYDVCTYAYGNVAENVPLRVELNITQPTSFSRAVAPANPIVGPVTIINAQCNMLPDIATATMADLTAHWGSCQNMGYDVNFQLVPRNTMATLTRQNATLLQQSAGSNVPAQPMLLQQSSQPGAPAPSNGMLVPGARPAMGAQPSSPTVGGFTGGVQTSGDAAPGAQLLAGSGSHLNGGSASAPSALIGLLRKQGSLKVVAGQRTHYALSANAARIAQLRQQRGSGQISAGQTMSAPTSLASRAARSPGLVPNIKVAYVPSDLLSQQENAWCEQQEAQGAAPAILRIDGKTTGINYSPDPKTNPHTIVGCGFGNGGTVSLMLGQSESQQNGWFGQQSQSIVTVYTVKFNVQIWSDHEIIASVNPDTSGVPDWFDHIQLEVKTKVPGYAFGGQFTALRQTVQLSSIPQNEASLYQAGSPYFLSPVSNYYGLDGTVGVMRQGLSGPVAGQDQFTLKLAPGFVVDSTQTDLLASDTNANVTSQPATVNGNTITVTYPVVSFQSGNSTVYYSIYGLKVWVSGPVGINPLVP